MRRLQKMLAASVLVVLPAAFASAQDQGGDQGGFRRRQFGGQNDQFGGYGGDRQSRRQYNGNGNGFGNGFDSYGGGRQRSFDNNGSSGNSSTSSPSSSTPAPVSKSDRPAFVPPVATGPFTFKAQQLPNEFTLLNTRSIFSKDHRSIQLDAPKKAVFDNTPVAALVLRGAMRLDTGDKPYAAQIEDVNSSKSPTWVTEGQILTSSGARVTEITLDHIVVEKNGVRRLITIGVNLDQGEKLATAPTGNTAPPSQPSGGGSQVKIAASDAGNTSGEDVADMMRRRRQQELSSGQ